MNSIQSNLFSVPSARQAYSCGSLSVISSPFLGESVSLLKKRASVLIRRWPFWLELKNVFSGAATVSVKDSHRTLLRIFTWDDCGLPQETVVKLERKTFVA